ncbi:MAG TPA: hypothetical protein VN796_09475 [Acidimicrobiales bacterium]|nr:hypothetical protein [Acidimicrobiales bacterium]
MSKTMKVTGDSPIEERIRAVKYAMVYCNGSRDPYVLAHPEGYLHGPGVDLSEDDVREVLAVMDSPQEIERMNGN